MTLDQLKEYARQLEMFGLDGFGSPESAVEFGQGILKLIDIFERERRLRDQVIEALGTLLVKADTT